MHLNTAYTFAPLLPQCKNNAGVKEQLLQQTIKMAKGWSSSCTGELCLLSLEWDAFSGQALRAATH